MICLSQRAAASSSWIEWLMCPGCLCVAGDPEPPVIPASGKPAPARAGVLVGRVAGDGWQNAPPRRPVARHALTPRNVQGRG